MPYSIKFDQQTGIVYTRQQQGTTPEERVQMITDLTRMNLTSGRGLLSDIRALKTLISGAESQQLMALSKAAKLDFRKVAILHHKDFSPYTMLASDAFLEGNNIEEFTSLEAAEAWLKS